VIHDDVGICLACWFGDRHRWRWDEPLGPLVVVGIGMWVRKLAPDEHAAGLNRGGSGLGGGCNSLECELGF
jgi:hypothetical protein